MANIKVRLNDGKVAIYNNVDIVALPTSEGGLVYFRQWNGEAGLTTTMNCTKLFREVIAESSPYMSDPTVSVKLN